MRIESDNAAVMAGFTRHVYVSGHATDIGFACLIRPDADLDAVVTGFDTDNQEMVRFNGWMADIEDA